MKINKIRDAQTEWGFSVWCFETQAMSKKEHIMQQDSIKIKMLKIKIAKHCKKTSVATSFLLTKTMQKQIALSVDALITDNCDEIADDCEWSVGVKDSHNL